MKRVPLAVLVLALTAPATGLSQEIRLNQPYPLMNRPVKVSVTDDGSPVVEATILVTYRPNSQTIDTETLVTNQRGVALWRPRDAGIARLELRSDDPQHAALSTLNVAIRFGGPPASGVAVMIVAGILLFGGAGFGMWLLLSGPRNPSIAEVEPPST